MLFAPALIVWLAFIDPASCMFGLGILSSHPVREVNWPIFGHKSATDTALQLVCGVQGRLQWNAKYARNPIDAYGLLGLDAHSRPFNNTQLARTKDSPWSHEISEQLHTLYDNLVKDSQGRNNSIEEETELDQHLSSALMAVNLLDNCGSRTFYRSMVLPLLDSIAQRSRKNHRCLWPRIWALNRAMCQDSWTTIGMANLVELSSSQEAQMKRCLPAKWSVRWLPEFFIRNWHGVGVAEAIYSAPKRPIANSSKSDKIRVSKEDL